MSVDTSRAHVEQMAATLPECQAFAPRLYRAADTLRALLAERDALWSLLRDGADLLDEARSEESEAWIARVAAMQARRPKNPAREAWERFCYATTTKEHFAAVKALDEALGVKCGQSPLVFGTDDEDDAG